ncbi:LuxR C-terminal-related transcriptional regulator [Sphingomonas aracearum]|uniref:LuxR C-terminal-related transcriptional regulator n=1 Tax=Sphingomonas aracearum TaxID=2283317 RepID=UPI0015F030DF|nr:response regulator transcription factor [Sphingomonas aracearum]
MAGSRLATLRGGPARLGFEPTAICVRDRGLAPSRTTIRLLGDNMGQKVKVALLGYSPISLEGLERFLRDNEFEICVATRRVEELCAGIREDDGPILIVVDNPGPDSSDIVTLAKHHPAANIVVLSERYDFIALVTYFNQGISGYLTKDISSASLLTFLKLVVLGEKVLPSSLAEALPSRSAMSPGTGNLPPVSAAGLSTRELQILNYLVAGHPNKIISRELDISEATVKVHVKSILRKTGVQNRTQAAIWALEDHKTCPPANVPQANGKAI